MDNRFNTIAGWALFSAIVALGLSSISNRYFGADKHARPETMGFVIEGVEIAEGAAEVPLATLLATADPAKGEQVFKKCTSCHTINQGGANGIGPNLYGTLGMSIAGHAGFAYSDTLKSMGGTWDFDKLSEFVHNPKRFAPGTKMTFAGLGNPEDRANLLVYLNAQGSNLPLPPPPAEPEVDAEPAADDTAGVGDVPEGEAGLADAGAVAQPDPQGEAGGDNAVGNAAETQAN